MRSVQAYVLLAALLLPFTNAVPVEEARTVDDSNMVRTPAGLRLIENVHAVPEGGSVKLVGSEIHLLDETGIVIHVATNDNAKIGSSAATSTTSAADTEESGWIAFAYWFNNVTDSVIDSFTTTWEVPPVPAENHNQTIFLFSALQPVTSAAILQPVLQFGPSAAGGGSYWAVASWYVGTSATFFSSLVEVTPGQELTGVVTLASSNGSSYDYVAEFTGIPGTSITANGSDVLLTATETLETYGITTAADYPTGSTTFYDINISVTSGAPETVWSSVSDTPDGVSASVAVQGYSNAEVVINYP
ncbi:hypothetical protein BT96DRAFT_915088 [Gymnopus androsaceus JB14]|uniref:Concanavalin A-like lectin/glucanase n=1 Tax=Gymnopus androsaceus JB14 TaxID=1447944 RepID=A0A6A4I8P8_9AGAR|nr:hypothetical protein BT96DRAFT_915088 [Gymnopus androsaceus JB14]